MKKILEVKNVTKKIKNIKILNNISFELENGKILGIVGKNGAGKSTLLKTIVGLSKPTSGKIIINGYDISKDFERAIEKVGSMIEVPSMYDYMTGYDNLNVFRMMFKNVPKERINEIIRLVSLEGSQYKKLKFYSLGMRQRLGLAQALINNPKLLILDEPTNGLDPVGIKDLRKFLKTLNDTSIIISSHILSEIENICDQVIFLDNGKIISSKILTNKNIRYKFDVDNKSKAKSLLSKYNVDDDLELIISSLEIPTINKILVDNDIKVFKISEVHNELENEFLKIIGEENND